MAREYVVDVFYVAPREDTEVWPLEWEEFLLLVFEVFVFDYDEFAMFLHIFDYFMEFGGSWAVVVFDVDCAHQVFLELFVVVEVDEVEQLVEYGLADVGFATDFVQYI